MSVQHSAQSFEVPKMFICTEKNAAKILSDDASVAQAWLSVEPGELFQEVCMADESPGNEYGLFLSLDRENVLMETDLKSMRAISKYLAELLLPVPRDKRIKLYRDPVRLEEFMQVEYGTKVTVLCDLTYPGVVHYQGKVPEKGPGIWFGVVLTHHPGQGDCDGSIHGKRYFNTNSPSNSAVFVTVADLLLRHEDPAVLKNAYNEVVVNDRPATNYQMNGLARHDSPTGKRAKSPVGIKNSISALLGNAVQLAASAVGMDKGSHSPRSEHVETQTFLNSNLGGKGKRHPPPAFQGSGAIAANTMVDDVAFKPAQRVCVLQDGRDPEVATVRWVGRLLREHSKQLYAGLEYDMPVGSGTGVYQGEQLFTTRPNHAAFVPLESLVPYEETQENALSQPRQEFGPLKVQPQLPKKLSYSEITKSLPSPAVAFSQSKNTYDASVRQAQSSAVSFPGFAAAVPKLPPNRIAAEFGASGSQPPSRNISENRTVTINTTMIGGSGNNMQQARTERPGVHGPKEPERSQSRSQMAKQTIDDAADFLPKTVQRNPGIQSAAKQNIVEHVRKNDKSVNTRKMGDSSTSQQMPAEKVRDMAAPSDKYTVDGASRNTFNIPIQMDQSGGGYYEQYDKSSHLPAPSQYDMDHKPDRLPSSKPAGRHSLPAKPLTDVAPLVDVDSNPKPFYYGMDTRLEPVSERPRSRTNLTPCQPAASQPSVTLRRVDGDTYFGKHRGIQGHKNSCYLDATLFSMFAFTNVFDELLNRPRRRQDIHGYEEVQSILRDAIVNPLRNTMFVACSDVMHLRELMDSFGDVTGLTNEERDPEEFLTSLFQQILKIDPLLKLTTGDCNWYTLFVEKNQMNLIPTMQQLFDESLVASDVRLKEVPKCLLLQTPRSGAQYKMYRYIFPTAVLDITDAIAGYPRQCSFCQEERATVECKECYGYMKMDDETRSGLSTMAFCKKCSAKRHQRNPKHNPYEIAVTLNPLPEELVKMELFAVVCIKTSHYVTFAKDGNNLWYFVDSMADREGGEGDKGSNIPEVRPCPELNEYLDPKTGHELLMQSFEQQKQLPEPISRFFEDCYFCMYQPITSGALGSLGGSYLINAATIL